VANAPFREHKMTNYEGGIASPLIAWWPGAITQTGCVSAELSHITDITATVLDAAGQTYPTDFNNRVVTPIAGKSLLPVLRGGTRQGHRSLCWATAGSKAVRMGRWKLVSLPGKTWELYDLSTDRTELKDLARREPERVAAMAKVFETWHQP